MFQWMVTGSVSSINTFNGFAEERFGKTVTSYICSLIQFEKKKKSASGELW